MRKRRPDGVGRGHWTQKRFATWPDSVSWNGPIWSSKNNNNISLRWLWITVTSLLFLCSDRHGGIEFDLGWQVTSAGGVWGWCVEHEEEEEVMGSKDGFSVFGQTWFPGLEADWDWRQNFKVINGAPSVQNRRLIDGFLQAKRFFKPLSSTSYPTLLLFSISFLTNA